MNPNQATLVISASCPHCASVLKSLTELIKEGALAKLEIINIQNAPDYAREKNIRSVPWFSLDGLEFQGEYSKGEIKAWLAKSATRQGKADYLADRLDKGDFRGAVALAREHPEFLQAVFELLAEPETKINVRLGIGALMEELEGSDALRDSVEALGELARHESPQIRADACHYLGMTGNREAVRWLKDCLNDPDGDVREIAEESLEKLQ